MKRVLITGAAGNLGGKIRAHLEAAQELELVLLDVDSRGDPAIHEADLGRFEDSWVRCFRDVDAVLHLAAEPSPEAGWERLERPNVDVLLNVLEASVLGGVDRLVFASSAMCMDGYRGSHARITPDLPPRPQTLYGVTKAVGERICLSFAERHGLSIVCLRIGAVRAGENDPAVIASDWYRKAWLSNRDWCQVAERALRAPIPSFVVLNAVSRNPDMVWDLEATERVIGYIPQDGCNLPPLAPEAGWLSRLRRRRRGWTSIGRRISKRR